MEKKTKKKTKAVAASGVAAAAILAILFGTGTLGLGGGMSLSPSDQKTNEEAAQTERVDPSAATTETRSQQAESPAESVEIRIQGREYNFRNVSYGSGDHPTEELLDQLKEFPSDARIVLIVDDNATKNAVDELERLLREAGFTDIHR